MGEHLAALLAAEERVLNGESAEAAQAALFIPPRCGDPLVGLGSVVEERQQPVSGEGADHVMKAARLAASRRNGG